MEIKHSSISGTFPMMTSTSTQTSAKLQEAQHQKNVQEQQIINIRSASKF
jgi:hypothetical protein